MLLEKWAPFPAVCDSLPPVLGCGHNSGKAGAGSTGELCQSHLGSLRVLGLSIHEYTEYSVLRVRGLTRRETSLP